MSSAASALSAEQMAFFDQWGYLVVDDVFTEADLAPVIEEIQGEINRRAEALVRSGELSRSYAEHDFLHRLTLISRETDKVAMGIWSGQLSGPAFFELIRHPRLLDIAQQMCGPEIIASSVYRLRPKIPGHVLSAVPWHQDAGYTEPFCDRYFMLTVWLPLVDANADNGCLWVIPGAHRQGVYRHVARRDRRYLVIPDDVRPPREPVCCPVKKGGVLLLHNLTPHASFDNSTDTVRWSMDLRYQSAALPTNYPMTRLPGEADPNAVGVPKACYPPEADCLIRSQARPQQVVADAQTFNRIRQTHTYSGRIQRWSEE